MAVPDSPSRIRRIVRFTVRGLLVLLLLAAVLAGAGAIWNAWALRSASAKAGVPGKLYQVDGKQMHLYCTGQGSPVVVLDAGLGNDSLIWGKNQPELSKVTRVCAYDRAGFGWSDARPGTRDSDAIAKELHGLLEQAAIPKPFIFMGHSIAGIHMRKYVASYPGDVAGIVFLDGSTPQQDRRFPPELEKLEKQQMLLLPVAQAATAIGVLRVLGQCDKVDPGFKAYAAWIKADSCHPSQLTSVSREMAAVPASGDETVNTGPFGNMPILIFSQDPDHPSSEIPLELSKKLSAIWNGMQEDLKKLSTHSRRIIAKGSSHYIQIDRAEMVNREVTKFIQEVRTGAVSAENGTTTRQ